MRDVRSPDFEETATGGWWRKPVVDNKPAWGGDEPLHFEYVENPQADPPVEQPGAIVPVPPAQDDAADEDEGDGPGGEGPGGIGPLDDVDKDDDYNPSAIEGAPAPAPRMSQRERRGVPPQRLIERIVAAEETDNGGAPATYGEALRGPEGKVLRRLKREAT